MEGFAAAWILGVGIVIWREVHVSHRLPVPGQLIGVSALFVGLDLFAAAVPASRRAVTLLAWGLDVAGLLNILPGGLYGQIQQAQSAEAAAQGEAAQPAPSIANQSPTGTTQAAGTTTAGGRG